MKTEYATAGGILVSRTVEPCVYEAGVEDLCAALDRRRGVILASGFEFPGRYSRQDLGFVDPPLAITSRGRDFSLDALNARGAVLLAGLIPALEAHPDIEGVEAGAEGATGRVRSADEALAEEDRSRRASVFSMLRAVRDALASPEDRHLGLYGAFAYDLCFQFEPVRERLARPDDQRDLVLYVPDEIRVVDHMRREAVVRRYDFTVDGRATAGLERATAEDPIPYGGAAKAGSDHAPGEYQDAVREAREAFRRGDLFEVVLGQTFTEPLTDPASAVFERLRAANPAPYGAFMNLGRGEALIAASPEMYVRVEGDRVETCPISGTIPRGRDALEDAANVQALLNSEKDASELTMCTDVDRNDKSRICAPGSVKVLGRRQLEFYSRLIHTVDHVEGVLLPKFDALDAFLTHMWAVTVTGAPKAWAMQFIEDHEKSARRWYGGAIGRMTFDGDMNTGLTIRAVRLADGVAEVRAGATLLYDSDPDAEEAETRLKASALFAALRGDGAAASAPAAAPARTRRRVLLVDHHDSFVHTLGSYLRQQGGDVRTLRPEAARAALAAGEAADLVVLSPGPGRPSDFDAAETLKLVEARGLAAFGVCLGLQAMVEYCGGTLRVLDYPMHGKASEVSVEGGRLFAGFPPRFEVGRYHSLYARADEVPDAFRVTATTADGVAMAIEHAARPWAAVQFHPESILTSPGATGLPLMRAVLDTLCGADAPASAV